MCTIQQIVTMHMDFIIYKIPMQKNVLMSQNVNNVYFAVVAMLVIKLVTTKHDDKKLLWDGHNDDDYIAAGIETMVIK